MMFSIYIYIIYLYGFNVSGFKCGGISICSYSIYFNFNVFNNASSTSLGSFFNIAVTIVNICVSLYNIN